MSDKITDSQIKYLKMLMDSNYSILNNPPEALISAYMDKQQVNSLDDLNKKQASILIGLLSSVNKFEKGLNWK